MKRAQDESNRNFLRQLQFHNEIGTNLAIRPFDWMAFKPDHVIYQVCQTPLFEKIVTHI
jgi:hypothetical protein